MDVALAASVTLATSCATQPFYGFVLLCWNQPTSFVAHFARRRIQAITDFFVEHFSSEDAHNTPKYVWFRHSTRAWLPNAALRAAIVFFATRRYFSSIAGRNVSIFFSQKLLKQNAATTTTTAIEEAAAGKASAPPQKEKKTLDELCAEIEELQLPSNRELIADTVCAVAVTALVAAALIPPKVLLTILSVDISGGYTSLAHIWTGVRSSAINDYDRANPIYVPGRNPWDKRYRRPAMVKLLWHKLQRLDAVWRMLVPWMAVPVANAAVFQICQFYFRRGRARDDLRLKEEKEAADSNTTAGTGDSNQKAAVPTVTAATRAKRVLARAAKVFIVSAVFHGAIAYLSAPRMSKAVRTAMHMPDYTQPYNIMGAGEHGVPADKTSLVVSDPRKLEVPRIEAVYSVLEATLWGTVAVAQAFL